MKKRIDFKEFLLSVRIVPKVISYLWKISRINVITIVSLAIITGFFNPAQLLAMQNLINLIQIRDPDDYIIIIQWIVVYLLLLLIGNITNIFKNKISDVFKLKVDYQINRSILKKAQNMNLSEFEDEQIYNMIKRAQTGGPQRIYVVFVSSAAIINIVIQFISMLLILISWSIEFSSLLLIIPIISLIFNIKLGDLKYLLDYNRTKKARTNMYINYLMTNDIAFKEIKIFGIGDYLINKFEVLYKEFNQQDIKLINKKTKFSCLFEFLNECILGIVIMNIVRAAFLGEFLLGNTVTYIRSAISIKDGINSILQQFSGIYENGLYINQFFDFIYLDNEKKKQLIDKISISSINKIEFHNVSFSYNKKVVLDKISFIINKGEKVSFLGRNGSGKTTIIKLILGFYDDFEGEIHINNISLRNINKSDLWKLYGVIFQDYTKYEFTVRENIGFGNIRKVDSCAEILKAAKLGSSSKEYDFFEKNLDTTLGSWFGGIQLSGGQWQSVALSRAFMNNSQCIILDEPTSALDPIAEHEIFQRVSNLSKDKISILISHRLKNINKFAQRIIFLTDGKITGDGTHEELFIQCDDYKKMYLADKKIKSEVCLGISPFH